MVYAIYFLIIKHPLMQNTFTFSFKNALMILPVWLVFQISSGTAQTLLVKWDMVGQFGPTATPSAYWPMNAGKLVSAVGQNTAAFVTSTGTATDPVMICNDWNVPAGNAWFMANFATTGFLGNTFNFVLGTFQFGPKNFKAQYSVTGSGGPWVDFGSAISFGTMGGSNTYNFTLPGICDNQSDVYVRLVTTTTPSSTGGAYFDEIDVTSTNPLAVNLISFDGKMVTGGVELGWITGVETNIRSYELQRSADGDHFTALGTIPAMGNSENHYIFTDGEGKEAGNYYYRLQFNQVNGNISYSSTIRVIMPALASEVKLYPNPAGDVLNVRRNAVHEGDQLMLVDTKGKVQWQQELLVTQSLLPLNIRSLAQGAYLLVIQNEKRHEMQVSRFMKN